MLFARKFDDLVQDALSDLVQKTRINKISPGSKARALIEAASRNLQEAYGTFDLNFARAFLTGATGRYLDYIGEMMGVSRAGLSTARATSGTKTVKFFVESGTFGDINDSGSILVTNNTIISTAAGGEGIAYRVTSPLLLSGSDNEKFVSVEAIVPGSSSNLGEGLLNFHDFTDYQDVGNNTLKVTNISGIFSGSETESDTNYRFRISQQALASETANLIAIRLRALQVPGVADVISMPFFKGIGSFRILIKAITPTVPDALQLEVESVIQDVAAAGIIAEANRPMETGLAFTIGIKYRKAISDSEKDQIEDGIRSSLREYVNSLDIGEEFVVNEAVERVLGVSEAIKDIGLPNKPFDELFVYRSSKVQDNRVREELLGNLAPQIFERIIIEPSLLTPIKINRI